MNEKIDKFIAANKDNLLLTEVSFVLRKKYDLLENKEEKKEEKKEENKEEKKEDKKEDNV